MKIGVPKEIMAGERRVALVPESAARLVAAGHHVLVETGAGARAYIDDLAYAGAQVVPDPHTLYAHAELVLKVRAPACHPTHAYDEIALLREGTLLIALLQPLSAPERMRRLAARGVTSFSLDVLPRITRAQGMDALSAMSTVAGYRAALLGATLLGRFFPLLMTAAGTVTPARVLVLGAGVAGLQAIATARRLGAIVQAFDTRAVVREQVQSLGASFLTVPLKETVADAGGYARELSEDSYTRERELLRDAVREADVVITTAMIPRGHATGLGDRGSGRRGRRELCADGTRTARRGPRRHHRGTAQPAGDHAGRCQPAVFTQPAGLCDASTGPRRGDRRADRQQAAQPGR